MARKASRAPLTPENMNVSQCFDRLSIVSGSKTRAEEEYRQWMANNPDGSAPGMQAMIGEYQHEIDAIQARLTYLNSLTPRK
jgi:hypothetical protein